MERQLLRRVFRCIAQCRILLALFVVGTALIVLGTSALPQWAPHPAVSWSVRVAAFFAGAGALAWAVWQMWRDYIEPIGQLRQWVLRLRGGDLEARMPELRRGEFADLAQDLNALAQMLQSLSRDTEQQLQRYTEHMDQKARSLAILYDVAASINVARDLDDLLRRCLDTLVEAVGAKAGAVRLLARDGQMRLVASRGLDAEIVERERVLPAQSCLCGQAVVNDGVLVQSEMAPCTRRVGRPFFSDDRYFMVVVPLQYRGRTLGVYNLYLDREAAGLEEGFDALLTSVGRHLGMAIDKARLDEETSQLQIMEERARLAHELHDSLAQTLASVRFQIRVLDETLHQGDEKAIWAELERIESSVEEANTELRELIAHFRAPVDKRGLIPSIERTVARFRQECPDVHVFLQTEWPDAALPPEYEMQVLRIVQEALANVRKHAQADTVRVLMRGDESGHYMVLVEDDGVGLVGQARSESPGEHVGLSIMEDRARKIGGTLQIESDTGEGVRVVLRFNHPPSERRESASELLRERSPHGIARSGY
jgi:two-component system nitrate/nitrite sensor histidine kinase NarX